MMPDTERVWLPRLEMNWLRRLYLRWAFRLTWWPDRTRPPF